MNKRWERIWQRWGDTVKFLFWGLTVALVCFLLYRVAVRNATTHLMPLSAEERDSLMTVAVPLGVDTVGGKAHIGIRRAVKEPEGHVDAADLLDLVG